MTCPYEEWVEQAIRVHRAHANVKYVSVVRHNGEVTVEFSDDGGPVESVWTIEEKARLASFARAVADTFPAPNYEYTASASSGCGWRQAIHE